MSIRFGSALRVLRTARGLSLRGLARKLNVSPAYLSQVENGKLPAPSHERILELSATLDVPPHRLFALASKIPPSVTQLLERTPEAGRFLTRAEQLGFPAQGFHKLVETLERLGVEGLVQLLEQAAPSDGTWDDESAVAPSAPPDFPLAPHLRRELIFVDLEMEAWADVIDTLAEAITDVTDAVDADDIATPLTENEYPDSVAIGGGVAIPYLALPSIDEPILAVARLAKPLRTAVDPELNLVFLLVGSPKPEIRNLRHLARIVQICTSRDVRQALDSVTTSDEFLELLLSADESIQ